MYSAINFMVDYKPAYFESIREIRGRESASRDEKARREIETMNNKRKEAGREIPAHPLVCRSMKHLPPRGICYEKKLDIY